MDFVVAGLGFGALIVVIGFAVRDLGPLFWRPTGYAAPAENAELRARWVERCRAVGTYSSFAGGAVLLVTIAAVVLGLSDELGAMVVAATALVACVAAAGLFVRSGQGLPPVGASTVPVLTVSTLSSDSQPEVTSVRRVSRSLPIPEVEPETPDLQPPVVEPVPAPFVLDEAPGDGSAPAVEAQPFEGSAVPPPSPSDVDETEAADGMSPLIEQLAPADDPPGGGGFFNSPLLADIGPEPLANGEGGFASSILAGVDHEAEATGNALSVLLEPDAAELDESQSEGAESEEATAPDDDRESPVQSGEDTLIDSRPAQIR